MINMLIIAVAQYKTFSHDANNNRSQPKMGIQMFFMHYAIKNMQLGTCIYVYQSQKCGHENLAGS